MNASQFVVAVPIRSVCDNYAQVLVSINRLRFLALGTRNGTQGVPAEFTRLKPVIGLLAYIAAKTMNPFRAESFRFGLLPWFDRWVLKQLQPGDHIISSYGYANDCFNFVRKNGGKTFVDAGNSHIENFWEILTEEHKRWKCPTPPVAKHWYERSRAMLAESTDYVFSPSAYVTRSFLERGFKPEQILPTTYPVDLSEFKPSPLPRPKDRPLTLINTGSLSLRKGTPYLLESFAQICKQVPSTRLLLTNVVQDDIKPIMARYSHLPIEWAPGLPHHLLAERLRQADIFILPSLEDGLARTACEALACGLQVILSTNTGAYDFIEPGVTGEIIPIRDSQAITDAVFKCWDRIVNLPPPSLASLQERLSFETFSKNFLQQLSSLQF